MNMNDCPQWNSCNAPLCPLDKDIYKRKYLKGEAICIYMREIMKPDSFNNFNKLGTIGVELYEAVCFVLPTLLLTHSPLKTRLNDASKTPSRLFPNVSENSKKKMQVYENWEIELVMLALLSKDEKILTELKSMNKDDRWDVFVLLRLSEQEKEKSV